MEIAKKALSQDFIDEFVKNLQGKDFILYGGLLTLAHANGIKGVHTELLQAPNQDNGFEAIVKAVVIDKDGNEWHGIGDANDSNCNKKVASHKIRMAETRAKGRALRDALGIDMVMDSELTDPYEKEMITQQQSKTIKRLIDKKDLEKSYVSDLAFKMFGVKTASRLLKEQADILIAEIEMLDDEDLEEDYEEVEQKPKSKPNPKPLPPSPFDVDDEEEAS